MRGGVAVFRPNKFVSFGLSSSSSLVAPWELESDIFIISDQ